MTELEKMQRAKFYMDQLANGTDPLSGAVVEQDTVLGHDRLRRCFLYVAEVLEKVIENGGEIGKKVRVAVQPFTITKEQKEAIEISQEPVGVMVLSKRIAAVLDNNVKPLSAVQITAWCQEQGFLREETFGGKTRKVAAAKGEQLGITTIEGISTQGIKYKKNIYSAAAQRYIVERIESIAAAAAAKTNIQE